MQIQIKVGNKLCAYNQQTTTKAASRCINWWGKDIRAELATQVVCFYTEFISFLTRGVGGYVGEGVSLALAVFESGQPTR